MKSKEEVIRRLKPHVAGTIALGSAKMQAANSGNFKQYTVMSYGEAMLDISETSEQLLSMIYDFIVRDDPCPNPPPTGESTSRSTPARTRPQ